MTSIRKNNFTLRCLAALLALILLILPLSGCANDETKAEKPRDDTFTIRTAKAVKTEVPFDIVEYIALLDDQLVIAGTSDDAPYIAVTDLEGNVLSEVEGVGDASGYDYIYGLSAEADGGFAVLLGNIPTPETDTFPYTISRYDVSGEHMEDIELKDAPQVCLGGIVATTKGEYISWDLDFLYIFDREGVLRDKISASNCEFSSLLSAGEQIFASAFEGGKPGVSVIDTDTGELGEFFTYDGLFAECTTGSGSDENLFINSGDALYQFNIAESEFTKLFDWSSTSLDGSDIDCLVYIEDDKYMCVSAGELFTVTVQQEEAERERIVVGAVSDGASGNLPLNELVSLFNKNNGEYYAEVEYYSTSEVQRLKTEMVAGTGPDVVEVSLVSMDMDLSADKYVDLLPYIDKEPSLSRDDISGGVLDSLLVDGKLTNIPAFFEIYTVTGRSDDVGTEPGWKISDLQNLLDTKGAGYTAFPGWLTSWEMMRWGSGTSMNQFVDWSNMTCNFTDDEFISLMNFCKSVPDEFDADGYTSDYVETILLVLESISNFRRLEGIKTNYAGTDITFIGFPNSGGNNGSFFVTPYEGVQLAIPGQTENKDAAWEFIREMLSSEYQSRIQYDLPVLKTELMSRLDEALSKEDAILTEEDIDKFLRLIDETQLFFYRDSALDEIILSEAKAFFTDDISAEEAAKRIDSRASLYLAEKSD